MARSVALRLAAFIAMATPAIAADVTADHLTVNLSAALPAGAPLQLGAGSLRWDAAHQRIAVAGPVWNSSTVRTPYSGSGDFAWNLNQMFYAVPGRAFDGGQYVAGYNQLVNYGTAPTQLWAGVDEANDQMGLDVQPGAAWLGREIDLTGNGVLMPAANGKPSGQRSGLVIVLRQGFANDNPVEADCAICVYAPSSAANGFFRAGLTIGGAYSTDLIDTRWATLPAGVPAVWLATGHAIALDSAGATRISSDGKTVAVKGNLTVASGATCPAGTVSLSTLTIVSGIIKHC